MNCVPLYRAAMRGLYVLGPQKWMNTQWQCKREYDIDIRGRPWKPFTLTVTCIFNAEPAMMITTTDKSPICFVVMQHPHKQQSICLSYIMREQSSLHCGANGSHHSIVAVMDWFNILQLCQNGHHFRDDIFEPICLITIVVFWSILIISHRLCQEMA